MATATCGMSRHSQHARARPGEHLGAREPSDRALRIRRKAQSTESNMGADETAERHEDHIAAHETLLALGQGGFRPERLDQTKFEHAGVDIPSLLLIAPRALLVPPQAAVAIAQVRASDGIDRVRREHGAVAFAPRKRAHEPGTRKSRKTGIRILQAPHEPPP